MLLLGNHAGLLSDAEDEPVRLRATITIDIEAADFVEAADHQRRLEIMLGDFKREYHQATLQFRERRERSGRPEPAPVTKRSGRLHVYLPDAGPIRRAG